MYECCRGYFRDHAGRCAGAAAAAAGAAAGAAGRGLLLAVTLAFSAACGSDDDTPTTSAGGATGPATAVADAGPPLRGEGFEPTPSFDISNPDREPPSRADVIEGVLNLNGGAGSGGRTPPQGDAGNGDAGDAS